MGLSNIEVGRMGKEVKYLTKQKREDAMWAAAMAVFFDGITKHYNGEIGKWLRSAALSLETALKHMLRGITAKELDTFTRMVHAVEPTLQLRKLYTKDDQLVTVDFDDLCDIAEYALEYCVDKCDGPEKCNLREVLVRIGIPAFVEKGPCQYWRKAV